jgi:hypothetical protein
MEEQRVKHLEFAQNIIDRMASNSFLLKGWTITLAAALFALAAKDSNAGFAALAFFPALVFWGLDAYYLRRERLYRCLYNAVRCAKAEDWQQTIGPFSLNTNNYQGTVASWFKTLWAPTIVSVHGTIVGVVVVVILAICFLG